MNARYGWGYVDASPDVRPAVRLRKELERDRLQGFTFDQVWLDEIDWALHSYGLDPGDVRQWRPAFTATEAAWRSADERTGPSVSSLQADLLLAA